MGQWKIVLTGIFYEKYLAFDMVRYYLERKIIWKFKIICDWANFFSFFTAARCFSKNRFTPKYLTIAASHASIMPERSPAQTVPGLPAGCWWVLAEKDVARRCSPKRSLNFHLHTERGKGKRKNTSFYLLQSSLIWIFTVSRVYLDRNIHILLILLGGGGGNLTEKSNHLR